MTKQKRLIMEIIRECHENRVHPTAEDIFFEARKKLPNIALGTVYRNLNILSEEGVIRRLSVAGNPDRFDLNVMTHDHLVCSRCGRLKDVEIKVLLKNALTNEINSRENFMKGIDHSYYYEGYNNFKTEEL